MTTPIVPSLGAAGPLFLQGGVGTTPGYSAIDDRRAFSVGSLQEGAREALAYKVAQRGAGANMSVDIDANAGFCVILGDHVTWQELYPVPPHSADINETVTGSDPTNPRIDQVVLELKDNTHDSSGANLAQTRVIAGTATSGATLDNRTGAAALPSSCMRLADVLVGAGVTSITTANIRDRRTWCRGGHYSYTRTATNLTTTNTSFEDVDVTNWKPRLECSGAPVVITFGGDRSLGATGLITFGLSIDAGTELERLVRFDTSTSNDPTLEWRTTPAAGSHTFNLRWKVSSSTGTISAPHQPYFTVAELVRQNAANG